MKFRLILLYTSLFLLQVGLKLQNIGGNNVLVHNFPSKNISASCTFAPVALMNIKLPSQSFKWCGNYLRAQNKLPHGLHLLCYQMHAAYFMSVQALTHRHQRRRAEPSEGVLSGDRRRQARHIQSRWRS